MTTADLEPTASFVAPAWTGTSVRPSRLWPRLTSAATLASAGAVVVLYVGLPLTLVARDVLRALGPAVLVAGGLLLVVAGQVLAILTATHETGHDDTGLISETG